MVTVNNGIRRDPIFQHPFIPDEVKVWHGDLSNRKYVDWHAVYRKTIQYRLSFGREVCSASIKPVTIALLSPSSVGAVVLRAPLSGRSTIPNEILNADLLQSPHECSIYLPPINRSDGGRRTLWWQPTAGAVRQVSQPVSSEAINQSIIPLFTGSCSTRSGMQKCDGRGKCGEGVTHNIDRKLGSQRKIK